MQTAQKREKTSIAKELNTAVRHSAIYGFGSVLAKVIGFCMLPFYTHYLKPVDYGVLEILDLSMSLFGMVFNMGMAASLLRYHAAAETLADKQRVVSTGFLFTLATGSLAMLAGSLAARPVTLGVFGPGVPSYYLQLSLASLILSCVANIPRTYLRALEASGAVVTLESGSTVLALGLNIFFIAYLKTGLVGILISSLVSNLLQTLVLSWWALRKVGLRFDSVVLRRMIIFGMPLIFSNLAAFSMNFSDRFFLQHIRSLEVVGIYAVGYKFGFMLNFLVVQPFCAMWEPRRYIIFNQPNHATVFSQIFTLYSLLLAYVWLGMSLFSPEIVRVMVGREFAASQGVIPIVAMAYVLWGIGYHAHLGMVLLNKTKMIGLISIGAVVLNLCLNYTLIHAWGMFGAAWATLLSFLGIATASFWFSQRVLPLPLHARRVACGIAIAVGLFLLSRYWQPGPIGGVLLFKACLLVAYPVVLWKGRILSADEISTLTEAKDHLLVRFSRHPDRVAAEGNRA